jgi:hypothetical protein
MWELGMTGNRTRTRVGSSRDGDRGTSTKSRAGVTVNNNIKSKEKDMNKDRDTDSRRIRNWSRTETWARKDTKTETGTSPSLTVSRKIQVITSCKSEKSAGNQSITSSDLQYLVFSSRFPSTFLTTSEPDKHNKRAKKRMIVIGSLWSFSRYQLVLLSAI